MNIALIFAGGTGQRMNTRSLPKQFLELHGKPVIFYTLEHFEKHHEINAIVVVCIKDWINELEKLLVKYGLEKVRRIVPGGSTGYASIYNGLAAMAEDFNSEDIVLIHDGVRPLINEALISANIAKVRECGTAITVETVTESVVESEMGKIIDSIPRREHMFTAKAPQSFKYGMIWDLYQKAEVDGKKTIDSAHLCSLYNVPLHMVESTSNNIKITAPQDYYIFRALYEAYENQQILGI